MLRELTTNTAHWLFVARYGLAKYDLTATLEDFESISACIKYFCKISYARRK